MVVTDRCDLPADITFEWTAGSHSLAAAAQRSRSTDEWHKEAIENAAA